jgi:hypothetical protein
MRRIKKMSYGALEWSVLGWIVRALIFGGRISLCLVAAAIV